MSEPLSVSIKLCGRTYRVKVAAENEATVRKTVQRISEKIAGLKKDFPGRDDHDYMAMTLLDHITSSNDDTTKEDVQTADILQKLQTIHNLLEE